MILKVIFFFSIFILTWTYFLYPIVMFLIIKLNKIHNLIIKKKKDNSDKFIPSIDFLIFTYNEEITIEQKIKNTLKLNYPKSKLKIYIIDSGSTDKTVEIANKYKNQKVMIIKENERRGKASAINQAIKKTNSEIIFFTDANAFLEKEAVKKIVKHFCNKKIGGVCGRFEVKSTKGKIVSEGGKIYWGKIERILREGESIIGSVIHLTGEISAIRRKAFTKLNNKNLGEDFDLTLKIIAKGYKLVYESDTYAFERAPDNLKDFFTQKRRIIAGSLQTMWEHRKFIFNPKYGVYGLLILPSHKLLPIFSPVFFISSFITFFILKKINLLYFFIYLLLTIVIVYLIKGRQFLAILYYFLISIIALIFAWYDFLFGKTKVTWEKIESSRKI